MLALAVLHHLLVGANLPMAAARDLFAVLAQKHLILEFVPTDDVMFRRLIEFRVNLYDHVTLDHCLEVFADRFTLLRQEPIQNSPARSSCSKSAADSAGSARPGKSQVSGTASRQALVHAPAPEDGLRTAVDGDESTSSASWL